MNTDEIIGGLKMMQDLSGTKKKKKEWSEKYPELLSVYVCRGLPGDPLFIAEEQYVLVNEFLAISLKDVIDMAIQ